MCLPCWLGWQMALEATVSTSHVVHAVQRLGLPFSSQVRGHGASRSFSKRVTPHPVSHVQRKGLPIQ